jgi:hypothetical protein
MDNFLEMAQDLQKNGEVEEVKEDFELVDKAVGYLREVHSKAQLDLNNIEVIFTAFEMGKLLGILPRIKPEKIEKLISSLKTVIGYTLEKTTKFGISLKNSSPVTYSAFSRIVEDLIEQNRDVAIMTFNYDLGLDFALSKNGIQIQYCLDNLQQNNQEGVKLLKLHGSLNWVICSNPECRIIEPYRKLQPTTLYTTNNYSVIPVVSDIHKGRKCKICQSPLEKVPFIVPPTWNKTAFHGQIGQVWKKAAEVLRDTENIFVIGYSFPKTDWFFNYLFALGVDMTTHIRGFHVYNTDVKVENRFKEFLGPDVISRFHYHALKFEDAVKYSLTPEAGVGAKTIPQILNISMNDIDSNIVHVQQPQGD